MTLNGNDCKVMFDNGSSLFPLLTASQRVKEFSAAPVTDTIQESSWGSLRLFTGRLIQQPFMLAGRKFTNTLIYAGSDEASEDYDAIAGNALFWKGTEIIDFRNKQFAIR